MQLHIVYTETNALLSKYPYASWREIQDAYETYMTSLGPSEHEEVIEYLADEYPDLSPSAQEQGRSLSSGGLHCQSTFISHTAANCLTRRSTIAHFVRWTAKSCAFGRPLA